MFNPSSLLLCPSCSCHARRGEAECPHCGEALTRQAGAPTPRSMAAVAMGLALAVALPLAGCGDDAGGGTGGAGGSDASSSSGDTTSSAVSTYGVAISSSSSSSSSGGDGGGGEGGSGGGGACLDEPFLQDPGCDSCLQDSCCAEVQACLADPENCSDAEGFIDPETSLGGPLLACMETECGGCGGAGICDSGLTTSDPPTDECLGESCCAEFNTCTSNSADIDACIACFDAGGGPLCDAAIACGEESCAG